MPTFPMGIRCHTTAFIQKRNAGTVTKQLRVLDMNVVKKIVDGKSLSLCGEESLAWSTNDWLLIVHAFVSTVSTPPLELRSVDVNSDGRYVR